MKTDLKSIYAEREARAPDNMHSDSGSSKIVWGTMADLNLIHLKQKIITFK